MGEKFDYWAALEQLWGRSTGGSDVAAKPSDDVGSFWPTAPRAAGVDAASQWFSHGLSNGSVPRMLFLVGGPGAGKSHTASEIVAPWQEIEARKDGLAHRTYRYAVGSHLEKELLVVNDATIRGGGTKGDSLVRDTSRAVLKGAYFLACVNRGILVEESQMISNYDTDDLTDTAGGSIVTWLHAGGAALGSWQVSLNSKTDYLQSGTLKENGEVRAEILVVYLDVCSMLEKSPKVSITTTETSTPNVEGVPYVVQDFLNRVQDSTETPTDALFSGVLRTIHSAQNGSTSKIEVDPVSANIHSLTSPASRRNLLSIWRAAEIVNSQKMTFRELWGAITRSLVADLPSKIPGNKIQSFLMDNQPKPSHTAKGRFMCVKKLADLRYSQATFGASANSDPLVNPVTRIMHSVDPAKDAKPGKLNNDWNSGWATPISDAFSGYTADSSPLDTLIKTIRADDIFHQTVSEFDRTLNKSFTEYMDQGNVTDKERHEAISWYGEYLSRLYAAANGIPAFRPEIVTWTQAWALAPVVPDQLSARLMTLLRPARRPEDLAPTSLIPVFDSRTEPIRGAQPWARLAVKLDPVEVRTERQADAIMLHLFEHSKKVSSISLDFALIRESLACSDGHAGVTELSETTSPRLERFRSARLVPDQLSRSDYRLVLENDDKAISLGGGF